MFLKETLGIGAYTLCRSSFRCMMRWVSWGNKGNLKDSIFQCNRSRSNEHAFSRYWLRMCRRAGPIENRQTEERL